MKPRNGRATVFAMAALILALVLGFLASGVLQLTTGQALLILVPLVLLAVTGYLILQRPKR